MKKQRHLLAALLVLLAFTGLAEAHYHPGLGRFISRDPIAERGGDNLYAFVRNDPVDGWDVLGLEVSEFPGDPATWELTPVGGKPNGTANQELGHVKVDWKSLFRRYEVQKKRIWVLWT